MMDKIYYPYKSNNKNKKFFIVTSSGKKVHFGDNRYQHYTEGHLDESRRKAYVNRHKAKEDWSKSGIDTAGFWSYHYLWHFKTYKEAYDFIKQNYL